jgi:hypothetical protein
LEPDKLTNWLDDRRYPSQEVYLRRITARDRSCILHGSEEGDDVVLAGESGSISGLTTSDFEALPDERRVGFARSEGVERVGVNIRIIVLVLCVLEVIESRESTDIRWDADG